MASFALTAMFLALGLAQASILPFRAPLFVHPNPIDLPHPNFGSVRQYIVALNASFSGAARTSSDPLSLLRSAIGSDFDSTLLGRVFASPLAPSLSSAAASDALPGSPLPPAFSGFTARLPPSQLQLLLNHPGVRYVEEDRVFALERPVSPVAWRTRSSSSVVH